MAFSVAAVSTSVSPLFTELPETAMFSTSAPRRFARELETGAGAGAVLKEQIDQRLAPQQVPRRFAGPAQQRVALGQIQYLRDVRLLHAFDREEVAGHSVSGWAKRRARLMPQPPCARSFSGGCTAWPDANRPVLPLRAPLRPTGGSIAPLGRGHDHVRSGSRRS